MLSEIINHTKSPFIPTGGASRYGVGGGGGGRRDDNCGDDGSDGGGGGGDVGCGAMDDVGG